MSNPHYLRPGVKFAVGRAVEECGELQSALGKSLRWGWLSVNPELPPKQQETNIDWVRREMADVRQALDNLEGELDAVDPAADNFPAEVKDALTPNPCWKRQSFKYYAAHYLVGSGLTAGDLAGNMRSLAKAMEREYQVGAEHGSQLHQNCGVTHARD